jgi:hypothetical protein
MPGSEGGVGKHSSAVRLAPTLQEAIPLWGLDPDEAEMQGVVGTPHTHICINGAAVAHEDILFKEDIEIDPREERWGDLAARDIVHLGLPVVFEADDKAHPVVIAGTQPC